VIFALEEEVLLLLTKERKECYLVMRGEVLIVQERPRRGLYSRGFGGVDAL